MNKKHIIIGQKKYDYDKLEAESLIEKTDKDAEDKGVAGATLENGIQTTETETIIESLEEEVERMEAEYQEQIKKDWLKFRVHAAEHEFSIAITDANNYDGDSFTLAKCKIDASVMLRYLYNEANDVISSDKFRDEAFNEIVDFAENRFTVEMIRAKKELQEAQIKDFEKLLDINEFKDEIEQKLGSIKKPQLKAFCDYYRKVEFESEYGDYECGDMDEPIGGLFNRLNKRWNYNAYDAYSEIKNDFIKAAEKYAEMATKVAVSALKKRVEWCEEIRLAS